MHVTHAFYFWRVNKKPMRKNFTPLLLIPGFLIFFACSKHESHPPAMPIDSTADNVYLDPGTLNALIGSDAFSSFDRTHAYDTGGSISIMAKALVNSDTCVFSINFADTLRINIPYANYMRADTAYIGTDTFNFPKGAIYFTTDFFDGYKGIVYVSGVDKYVNGDTLLITTFDKSKHLLAGTFKTTMTASTSESPYITQPIRSVTGSFNTYYNIAK